MSKFFNIDDWQPVDVVSTVAGVVAGLNPAMLAGFSVFMSGEAESSPTDDKSQATGNRTATEPAKRHVTPRKDIMDMPTTKAANDIMAPPKPTWVTH